MQSADLLIWIQKTVSMELDQKVRYALVVFGAFSLFMTAHGVHAGVHLKAFEGGGNAD